MKCISKSIPIDDNRWSSLHRLQSIKSHKISHHRLVIYFQYQSITCYRLISIDIDFYRLPISSIEHAGLCPIAHQRRLQNVNCHSNVRLFTACSFFQEDLERRKQRAQSPSTLLANWMLVKRLVGETIRTVNQLFLTVCASLTMRFNHRLLQHELRWAGWAAFHTSTMH